jgi:hypothetical protein
MFWAKAAVGGILLEIPGSRSISRLLEDFYQLSYPHQILNLILFGMIAQCLIIAIDQAFFTGLIDFDYGRSADLAIFNERGRTILEGGLLYRDVHTESPPFVNYLLVIPVMLGGTHLAYQVFFSACNIIAALMLFSAFRSQDVRRASLVAILFLGNPFTIYHSTLNPQDEPLVLLFFLTPLILMAAERFYSSAVATGIGIWTKMWPFLLTPLYLLERRPLADRMRAIAIMAAISAMVMLPFMLLCPDDACWFMSFYFLGVEGEGAGGISLWRFLDEAGAKPPTAILLTILAGAIIGSFWYAHKRGWDRWTTVTVVVVLFFLFYPKVHTGYYLLPLALLLPYLTRRLRFYYLTVPMFALVVVAHKFTDGALPLSGALIAVPIALAISTDLILVYLLDQAVLTPMAEMRDGDRSWTISRLRAAMNWLDDRLHGGSGSDHSG